MSAASRDLLSSLAGHRAEDDDAIDAAWHDAFEAPGGAPRPVANATLSGFGRYRTDVGALPPGERAKIMELARQLLRSTGLGRTPVRTVRIVGHADRDAARGPAFERAVSLRRAVEVRGALASAVERLSAAGLPEGRPQPPITTRLHWKVIPAGAERLVVASPRSEAERMRNRRVEVTLLPVVLQPTARLAQAVSGGERASPLDWIREPIARFCEVVPSNVRATNCCRAVRTAGRLLEASRGPGKPRKPFTFAGVAARKLYQGPFSPQVRCCQFGADYWKMCGGKAGARCAHCVDLRGPHLVLEYPAKRLAAAVDRVKQELSQGFTVAAGVLSGICDDKPDVGCARKLRQEGQEGQIWSLCPEHWLLLLAHDAAGGVDTFLFWDSSQASAIHTRGHLRFGLLEYDRETPRLSTARAAAGADRMVVNGEGMHLAGYPSLRSQKRFQVLQLSSTAPCTEWPGPDRCGDYDENARFVPEACKIVPL